MYHVKCVDVWFRNDNKQCPLCRNTVTDLESSSDSHYLPYAHLQHNESRPLLVVTYLLIF
ncbi:hypothetical protein B4U80_07535 [Leptotrombidium deliense]|uniref:RING-type domain-containing protein n=1 Tax=Leptotrombidium deliense TaxID=299467 RepID=A0A443RW07_9ACAR|nr:hypothetical protein B4U80_07535 [Leptotrombidium deliense]